MMVEKSLKRGSGRTTKIIDYAVRSERTATIVTIDAVEAERVKKLTQSYPGGKVEAVSASELSTFVRYGGGGDIYVDNAFMVISILLRTLPATQMHELFMNTLEFGWEDVDVLTYLIPAPIIMAVF